MLRFKIFIISCELILTKLLYVLLIYCLTWEILLFPLISLNKFPTSLLVTKLVSNGWIRSYNTPHSTRIRILAIFISVCTWWAYYEVLTLVVAYEPKMNIVRSLIYLILNNWTIEMPWVFGNSIYETTRVIQFWYLLFLLWAQKAIIVFWVS